MADGAQDSGLNRREFLATTSGSAAATLLKGGNTPQETLVSLFRLLADMPHIEFNEHWAQAEAILGNLPGSRTDGGAEALLHNIGIIANLYRRNLDFCDVLDKLPDESRKALTHMLGFIESSQHETWEESVQALRPGGKESLAPNPDKMLELARKITSGKQKNIQHAMEGLLNLELPEEIQTRIYAAQRKAEGKLSEFAARLAYSTGMDVDTVQKAVDSALLLQQQELCSPKKTDNLKTAIKEIVGAYRSLTHPFVFAGSYETLPREVEHLFRQTFPDIQFPEREVLERKSEEHAEPQRPSEQAAIYPSVFTDTKRTLGQIMASLTHKGWQK